MQAETESERDLEIKYLDAIQPLVTEAYKAGRRDGFTAGYESCKESLRSLEECRSMPWSEWVAKREVAKREREGS